ncbi:MAG TPA: NAD(P)/FAD-dependent oxidoreductase [Allosphingosinicella sp.]|nr:NAD(P)/FAD-dependent oxidoreductase [Allosphingosinicella sp.]
MRPDSAEHVDVLIVGAGISGVDAAYHLQTKHSGKSYAVLEARKAIGGTWDLFRYPGIRSDSDMYTLGFPFRPWRGDRAIADGASIRAYVEETAREFGIHRHIRFGHKVTRASWSSAEARWTVEVDAQGGVRRFSCGFLYLCSGYYDYERGYRPEWPGEDRFAGRFVHPQHWPEDLDFAGKRVVVVGSGATAVTLVPALTDKATHVTMLQRSPSYIVSLPSRDPIARLAGKLLPGRRAAGLVRWKNVLLARFFFRRARARPEGTRRTILKRIAKALPKGYDVEKDFSPSYQPWDQRLCLVPDNDLFDAMRAGKASIVTDSIAGFTETGIALRSGRELGADIVVTATGLVVRLLGGIDLNVDGKPVSAAGRLVYKGMMFEDIPNLAFAFGYTNASWTLKCDLTARYLCRLLRHMDEHGHRIATPRLRDPSMGRERLLAFSSGYIERAISSLPVQGAKPPWRVPQDYVTDLVAFRFSRLADEAMEFKAAGVSAEPIDGGASPCQ